jgi:maltoporin
VVQLNRQRMIASASGAYLMDRGPEAINAKVKVHGEVQAIDSGTRRRDDGTLQALPSDWGMRLGAELSLYGMAPKDSGLHRHMNLFARYAKGLASFDELAPPTSFGNDLTTSKASELSFGLSGNWDGTFGNVMIAGLSRRFLDATGDADHASGWEYAVAARPLLAVGGDVYVGADLSYQVRFPQGLNATTLRAEDPSVVQIAPMIVLSPMGPSAYDRPQLRVVYRAAHLNDGARDEYVPDDPRHAYTWVHFLGFEAEWWFNSTYR